MTPSLTSLSCQLEHSSSLEAPPRLVCPVESAVALPSSTMQQKDLVKIQGWLSCPVTLSRNDDHALEECSCEGSLVMDENDQTPSCTCSICPLSSSDSTTFAWTCHLPIPGGNKDSDASCWGWDCQGNCIQSKDGLPDKFTTTEEEDATWRVPSSAPSLVSFHPFNNKTVLAAQSASLLWMLGVLAVTQNSTEFWSMETTASGGVVWQ